MLLLPGGYASTAIAPIEVFHSAGSLWNWLHGEREQPRFRVRTVSLDGDAVDAVYPVQLRAQCTLAEVERVDLVLVPASGWDVQEQIVRSGVLLPWLRKQHEGGAYVAGICTGVAFLAEAGLLDGRRATTHWAVAEQLRARYPQVLWRPEQFVTEDGAVLCSGGVYASIDLSLYLVEKFCGHEVALECAKSLLVSMPRSRQSGYSVLPLSRPHVDEQVRRAEEYLQRRFHTNISIEDVARSAGMSARNFIRRFKSATGRLPGAYLQQLRIDAAKRMLEGGRVPIQNVCSTIGYEDLAFFRKVFKRHTGMTPAEYRKRFAPLALEPGDLQGGDGLWSPSISPS